MSNVDLELVQKKLEDKAVEIRKKICVPLFTESAPPVIWAANCPSWTLPLPSITNT